VARASAPKPTVILRRVMLFIPCFFNAASGGRKFDYRVSSPPSLFRVGSHPTVAAASAQMRGW